MCIINSCRCVICWNILQIVSRDPRQFLCSFIIWDSSCIATSLMYICSCEYFYQIIAVSEKNSFELIFVYSRSICTPKSSGGCLILWIAVRHMVVVKGGRQPVKETTVFVALKQLSQPLFFQSSSRQSELCRLPQPYQHLTGPDIPLPPSFLLWCYNLLRR